MGHKIAGDFVSVFISHPTAGNFNLVPVGGAEGEIVRGGRYTDDAEIGGDSRSVIEIMKTRPGEFTVELQAGAEEMDFLQALTASPGLALVTYTHISGDIYSHNAKVVGDLKHNASMAKVSVTIKGEPIVKTN